MSGYKRATVTISQEEYRRLHDADMQKRFKKKKKSKDSSKEVSPQLEALKSAYSQVESRQDHYEQLLGNLSEEVRSVEWQASEDLIMRQAAFYDDVIHEIEHSADEMEASLENRLKAFQEELQSERETYLLNIQDCMNRIDEMREREDRRRALADSWMMQCSSLHDFIAQDYDTNHFVPGRLERIEQRLNLARMNLGYGMADAALSTAQTAYLELSELRVELEAMTLEWQNLFALAYSALKELKDTILTNAHIPALDAEGNELPILIDVDLWSNRQYHAVLEECQRLCRRLAQHTLEIHVDELRELVAKVIPGIRYSLDTAIYESRLHAIQAQMRANIAELALEALASQGFTMVEAGYLGDSADAPYDARLLHRADGISVRVSVVPQEGQQYVNDIIVVSEDSALKTEHEMLARFGEIRSAFTQYGLSVGPTQTTPDSRPAILPADPVRPQSQQNRQTEIMQDVRTD